LTGSPTWLPVSFSFSRKIQLISEIKEVSTGLTWLNLIALWLTIYLHSKGHLMVVTLTTARSQL
ncbi:hypothetical protein, partial [Aeromonas dhakensis]|uniref:hypothetical protein n=1 Tax=Aeromonas dhakensis TaxID=196024 RepID=UPI001BDDE3D0